LPTFKFEIAPLFTVGRALFTWASATSVASTANTGKAAPSSPANPTPTKTILRTRPIQILKDGIAAIQRDQKTRPTLQRLKLCDARCWGSHETRPCNVPKWNEKLGAFPF
jgi:hypothetical protein